MVIRLFTSVLLSLFFVFPAAFAGKEKCNPLDVFKQFEAEKKTVHFVEIELSDDLSMPSPQDHAAIKDYYKRGKEYFRESWSDDSIKRLKEIAKEVDRGNMSAEAQAKAMEDLKRIRTPMKILRFLMNALGKDAEVKEVVAGSDTQAKNFDEMTKAIGKLRNTIEKPEAVDKKEAIERIRQVLKDDSIKKLNTELKEFAVTGPKGYNRWLKAAAVKTRQILSHEEGTGHEFHVARKNLQAMLVVCEAEIELSGGTPALKNLAKYLLKFTEEMGEEVSRHEDLAATKGPKLFKQKYQNDVVTYLPNHRPMVSDINKFLNEVADSD